MASKKSSDGASRGEDELDYEFETELGETEAEQQRRSVEEQGRLMEAMLEKLLQGGLAKSIQNIVATETAKALGQAQKPGEGVSVSHSKAVASGSRAGSACSSGCSVQRTRAGGEILEPFDPDNKDCKVERWLCKIDQLGEIHGWSEYERACFMQAKLQGGARAWFNRLDRYDFSWAEWKATLQQAFPREHDYAELIVEMMARVKMEGESMTHYYHDKMALIERCEITGKRAISILIHGLPERLRANARAVKCSTANELYTAFLSSFDRYQEPKADGGDLKRRNSGGHGVVQTKVVKRQDQATQGGIRCYNCQEIGTHISRDCPKPKANRCMRCGQAGHDRFVCPNRSGAYGGSKGETGGKKKVQVRLVDVVDNTYKKMATLEDGTKIKAYIDTGSEQNIIRGECLSAQGGLKIEPSSVVLQGVGGGLCTVNGEATMSVTVDKVPLKIKVLIAECDLGGADLLLGQPALATPGVGFRVQNGKAQLFCDEEEENPIARITLDEDEVEAKITRRVLILQTLTLNPGEKVEVDVVVEGMHLGEKCWVPARRYEHGGAIVTSGNHILEGGHSGRITVHNLGHRPVQWKAGQLMARATTLGRTVTVRKCSVSNEPLSNNLDLSCIKVGDLDEYDRAKLHDLLKKMAVCFSQGDCDLGVTDLGEMKIQLTTDKPVAYRPYRLSVVERAKVREKVSDLMDAGVIRESESEYASPIVLIRKQNGDMRMCVDYRALNAITIKNKSPLPRVEDQLDRLAGKCFYSTLDMAQGYHQVPMHEDSISKTAFVTPDGHYEYLRVPFGLANAPVVFQKVVNKMLQGMQNDLVLAYMDDILIPSATISGGLAILEQVLQLVAEAGLKLNLAKCTFLHDKLEYLGHEVSASGIRPGKKKIQAVSDFPIPTNVHGVRQFVGLASYFRKFVKDFAIIAKPLTNLLKKDVPWRWENHEQAAFEKFKLLLAARPILALYDSEAETELHTDASKLGVAGILMQRQASGDLKPVSYYSRATTAAEQSWHSYELETLAIVESVKRFRVYLIGTSFKVVTDCSAVRATMVKKDLLPRIARWWMALQEYDMSIEYRAGQKMQHVDALSRNPVVCLVNLSESDWFLTVQLQDEKAQALVNSLNDGTADKGVKAVYKLANGRLYRKTLLGERLYVPAMAKFSLVRRHHDDIGHPGFERCLGLIKQTYWFPKMGRFVRKYVKACMSCAFGKGNYGRAPGQLHPIEKVAIPFHTVHIDHVGPFCRSKRGNQYVLMVVDAFTKYTLGKATRSLRSSEAILKLREVFGEFGYPRRIISDRGLAFTSKVFAEFLAERGVKHVLNAIATPRANGQVERQNRTLLNAIEASATSEVTWDEKLSEIVWGLNHANNQSTGFSPAQLMFAHGDGDGVNAELSGDVQMVNAPRAEGETYDDIASALLQRRHKASENLTKARRKMKVIFDRRRKVATTGDTYKVGDLVLWSQAGTCSGEKGVNRKMINKYDGPYRVAKVLGNDRYVIMAVKGVRGYKAFKAVVAVDSLRPFHSTFSGDSENDESESDGENIDRKIL